MYFTVLYCELLYCIVLYCTVLYCTVLYCALLYCTVLCVTVLYCTVLCVTVLHIIKKDSTDCGLKAEFLFFFLLCVFVCVVCFSNPCLQHDHDIDTIRFLIYLKINIQYCISVWAVLLTSFCHSSTCIFTLSGTCPYSILYTPITWTDGHQLRSTLPYIRTDIPVVIVFRALGFISDKYVLFFTS